MIEPGDAQPEITPEILAASKDLAKRRIVHEADRLGDLITGEVPRSERDSWTTKAIAAEAHLAGSATAPQSAMLQVEAGLRGNAVDVLAEKIRARATVYGVLAAKIAAQRSLAFEAVDASQTITDIEAALTLAEVSASAILQEQRAEA